MNALTPLIELASHKSLDLFFRVGQGYVACAGRGAGLQAAGRGLTPLGVQSRAAARIVCMLPQHVISGFPPRSPSPIRPA